MIEHPQYVMYRFWLIDYAQYMFYTSSSDH